MVSKDRNIKIYTALKLSTTIITPEGQETLNRLPEFCLKLTYSYLLKADIVPGDTKGRAIFGPMGII